MAEFIHAKLQASRKARASDHLASSLSAAADTTVNMHGRSIMNASSLRAASVDATTVRVTGGVDAGNSNVDNVATLRATRVRCSGDAVVRALEVKEDIVGVRSVRCSEDLSCASVHVGAGGVTLDAGNVNLCGGKVENVGALSLSGELSGSNAATLKLGGKVLVSGAAGDASFAGEVSAGGLSVSGAAAFAQKLSLNGGMIVSGGPVQVRGAGTVDMSSRSLIVGPMFKCDALEVTGRNVAMRNASLDVDAVRTAGDVVAGGGVSAPSGDVTALAVRANALHAADGVACRSMKCDALAEVGGQLVFTGAASGGSGLVMNGGPEHARKDILGAGSVTCDTLVAESRVVAARVVAEAVEMPDENASSIRNAQTMTMRANAFAKIEFPRGGSVEGFDTLRPQRRVQVHKVRTDGAELSTDDLARRFNELLDSLAALGLIEAVA